MTGKVVRTIKTLPTLSIAVKNGMGIELLSPPDEYLGFVRSLYY